jgi:hypothetical protein
MFDVLLKIALGWFALSVLPIACWIMLVETWRKLASLRHADTPRGLIDSTYKR